MALTPSLRCGPAGWAHAHWSGLVYPRPRPRAFHPLEYLAQYFDLVEIDSSFHQPLRPEITRLWMKQVAHNPRFVFTARLGRRFTYERVLEDAEVHTFAEGLRPLARAGKLGCLLMQFPWSFRFTEENKQFFIQVRRTFHEFPLVAEMRHSSWMVDEALGVLMDYRVGFCNIDQPPHLRAMPPTALLTSSITCVRLHGRSAPESASDYLYPAAELDEWRPRIEHLAGLAPRCFVVTANDGGGKSVVNALQLQAMLGDGRREAPPDLLAAYPRELESFSAAGPVQSRLFAAVA